MFSWRWPKSAFIAGEPILDFLNTVDFCGRTRDANRLTSYVAVVEWSLFAGVITRNEALEISAIATNVPFQADRILSDLVLWREAAYRAFLALIRREQASVDDWGVIEESIQRAVNSASLKHNQFGIAHWRVVSVDLTTIPKRLALQLSQLLCTGVVAQIKKCEGCTWLFIDRSKNHRRRWCAMATCGNRAKAQRYRP